VKCRVCRRPAVIELRRHNAGFCAEDLARFCRQQVAKAIEDHAMLAPGERVLVAVSGGKDSLALWDVLTELGYEADGLYLGLGIGDYSHESRRYAKAFASARGLTLREVSLREDLRYDVPTAAAATRRPPCSSCGLSKRHLFDRAALAGGYAVVATGHNLDDEAAVLFGNTLRWEVALLARQLPVLPARHGLPRKVKPLVRLTERETAAYCVVRGIDYLVEECPMADGNRHLGYKAALNAIEDRSPGTKAAFYFGFLDRIAPLLAGVAAADQEDVRTCERCGAPTTGEVCAFCRLIDVAASHEPVPVELVGHGRARW
jgi:uncharacterized protein (TIGR00269 family)